VQNIDQDGYSTKAPFVDSPFGGTLDLFGDFRLLVGITGAAKYKIVAKRDSGQFAPILASWTNGFWNPNAKPLPRYEDRLVAPDSDGFYTIPSGYTKADPIPPWQPRFLMLRWPTTANGLYVLQLQLFDNSTPPKRLTIPSQLIPLNRQSLTVQIDNSLPVAELRSISEHNTKNVIQQCQIVSSSPPSPFDFELTAFDEIGHLLSYSLQGVWGRNPAVTISSEIYKPGPPNPPNPSAPHKWQGSKQIVQPAGGWPAVCNCAHTFTLVVSKRTTNGYRYILSSSASQSITINNTPNTCR
jgi:hypothetical protein